MSMTLETANHVIKEMASSSLRRKGGSRFREEHDSMDSFSTLQSTILSLSKKVEKLSVVAPLKACEVYEEQGHLTFKCAKTT